MELVVGYNSRVWCISRGRKLSNYMCVMILQCDHVLYIWDGLRNCHFLRDRLWNVSQLVKQNKQDNVSTWRRRNLKSGLLNHEVILVHTKWFRRKIVCAFPQLISLFSLKEATWHKVYMLCDVYQHDRRYNWMVQRQQRGSKVVTLTNLLWWWICWYYMLIKVRHIIASHHVTVYYVHDEMLCVLVHLRCIWMSGAWPCRNLDR